MGRGSPCPLSRHAAAGILRLAEVMALEQVSVALDVEVLSDVASTGSSAVRKSNSTLSKRASQCVFVIAEKAFMSFDYATKDSL